MNPIQPRFSGLLSAPVNPELLAKLPNKSTSTNTGAIHPENYAQVSDDGTAIECITPSRLGDDDSSNLKRFHLTLKSLINMPFAPGSDRNSDDLNDLHQAIMRDVVKAFLTPQGEEGAVKDFSKQPWEM